MELNKFDKELDEFYVSMIARLMVIQEDCDMEIRMLEIKRGQLRRHSEGLN